ncbi:alpha-1B adrenergic receptor-like [Pocillopora verrucosa]|uniref:alpha-1B adrenergic receptor-like n=1 Tax=Pocillopora verrucosa TaxID=203993 RepID=UPI00333EE118
MTSKFEANYSSNSSANPNIGFETVVTVNCILNAPLMLLSIIGNALLLVAILRTPSIQQTPSLRSPSVIFLCNLAVSDLLVGLVVQPVYIVEQMVRIVPKLQEAVGAMRFAGCGVSLSTMTAITVDRFFALHYHLQHPNLMTTSRAIYTIITIRSINYLNSRILWTFPVTVAFMNSSINPFLYCWRIPGLRTAVFKTARLLSCREMD